MGWADPRCPKCLRKPVSVKRTDKNFPSSVEHILACGCYETERHNRKLYARQEWAEYVKRERRRKKNENLL